MTLYENTKGGGERNILKTENHQIVKNFKFIKTVESTFQVNTQKNLILTAIANINTRR